MKLVVSDVKKETVDAVSISFKNNAIFNKVKYKPGQFLTLSIRIDNTVHKRAYSFSSSPYSDKGLKITVKRVEKGLISNYLNDKVAVGDKIEIEKPAGSFFIVPEQTREKQYVLFAGGSGITPIYSIIKSILEKEPKSKILLIYANQNKQSIIFYDEVTSLSRHHQSNLFIEHILSTNSENDTAFHTGLATASLVEKIFLNNEIDFSDNIYMICGPFGYMEKIKEILAKNGVTRDQIKIEVFKSPEIQTTGKNLLSDVTLKLNGNTHQLKIAGDKSILQEAMSNNIVVPYSCRSGMCSTCMATCTSGEINMTEGHFLEEKLVSEGKILTCVSYPASESVVIEW